MLLFLFNLLYNCILFFFFWNISPLILINLFTSVYITERETSEDSRPYAKMRENVTLVFLGLGDFTPSDSFQFYPFICEFYNFVIFLSSFLLYVYFHFLFLPFPTISLVLPQIHSSSFSFQKRASLPLLSTKQGITSCKMSRHKPSHQCWMRQPSRRKGLTSR